MSSQLQTYLRYTCDILPIYQRFHLYVRYVSNICPYLVIIRDPANSYVRCLMRICQYLAIFKDILQNMKYMSPLSAQYQRDLTNIKEVSFISAHIWLILHRVDIYVLQISNISAYILAHVKENIRPESGWYLRDLIHIKEVLPIHAHICPIWMISSPY